MENWEESESLQSPVSRERLLRRQRAQQQEQQHRRQPLNWSRAFWSGFFAASLMMAFVDVFYMFGVTRFSFENYLGILILGTEHGAYNWSVGILANWLVGGIFGFFYGYFFEYVFRRATPQLGVILGYGHAMLAALIIFPFFTVAYEQLGLGVYYPFGILGSKVDPSAPILIFVGHLLFGATMGLFYGPIGTERLRARYSEPGESGFPGDRGVITEEEDPEDATAA